MLRQEGGAMKQDQTVAPPAKAVYAGYRENTYAEYVYHNTGTLYVPTSNGDSPDTIQSGYWMYTTLGSLMSGDGLLELQVRTHDFFKVLYCGIETRPKFDTVGPPSTLYAGGDYVNIPVTKETMYTWAVNATAGSPTFTPGKLYNVLPYVAGTKNASSNINGFPKWRAFQPGFNYESYQANPNFKGLGAVYRTRLVKMQWTPCFFYGSTGASFVNNVEIFGPCGVFANWGSNSNTQPARFEIKIIVKFAFKDKRVLAVNPTMGLGAPGSEAEEKKEPTLEDLKERPYDGGIIRTIGEGTRLEITRTSGYDIRSELLGESEPRPEEYVELDDPEEKDDGGMGLAPPPAQKKPALHRALTNLNLGVQVPPRVTKRTSEMSQK